MNVSLNPLEGKRAFRSSSHLLAHVDEQISKFEELQKVNANHYQRWGQTLHHHWLNTRSHLQGSEFNEAQFAQNIVAHPCVDFSSPLIGLLQENTDANLFQRVEGVLRAIRPRNDNETVGNSGVLVGTTQAVLEIALAKKISSSALKKTLGDLIDDHERRFALVLKDDEEELQRQRDAFTSLHNDNDEKNKTQQRQTLEFLQNASSDWTEAYDGYIEQLKTQTAVELWETRATRHTDKYGEYRRWTGWVALVGGIAGLVWIFGGFGLAQYFFPKNSTAQIGAYSAGSILLFTLLVWTLRVLVRSMISENHLATDASARSAMAHTYLALSKEGLAREEDRAIVLASLFSPVSDGLVKDDGMPVLSPTAMAAAALTNPKGPG